MAAEGEPTLVVPSGHASRIQAICRQGDEVVLHKEKLIEINRLHNSYREALGAMRRNEISSYTQWIDAGGFFIKAPLPTVKREFEAEQRRLEEERENERLQLKESLKCLVDLHPQVSEMSPETLQFLLQEPSSRETDTGSPGSSAPTVELPESEGKRRGQPKQSSGSVLKRGFLL